MIMPMISIALLIGSVNTIQVTIEEGIVEGAIIENRYGNPYYSFKGIPYAEPPLGDLRFKVSFYSYCVYVFVGQWITF